MPAIVVAEGMRGQIVFNSMRPTSAMSIDVISLPIAAVDFPTAQMASLPRLNQNFGSLLWSK